MLVIQKNIINVLGVIHLVRMKNFLTKSNIFYPLIRTRTSAYEEVTNVSFSGNFANVLNK